MGECACVHIPDMGEAAENYHCAILKTEEPLQCEECRRRIEPGEQYEYVKGRWGGHDDEFRTCMDCLSIRKSFFCEGFCHGSMEENLAEHIRDLDGQVATECILPLTPRAREMVFGMIEETWECLDEMEAED